MATEHEGPIATAVSSAVNVIYDQVAVRKESVLKSAAARGTDTDFATWEEYQRLAPFFLMDDLADQHIQNCRVTVASLGAAAGFGGLITAVPDALQFVTGTLRMVTGIAAAYGFDPDPDARSGRNKVMILQAYLNANLGQAGFKSGEAVTLSAVTTAIRSAATRSKWLMRIILLIGRIIGIRLTRGTILRAIPVVSSGINAGFNWKLASDIAKAAKAEFKHFRDELRLGKYRNDPNYEGLGN